MSVSHVFLSRASHLMHSWILMSFVYRWSLGSPETDPTSWAQLLSSWDYRCITTSRLLFKSKEPCDSALAMDVSYFFYLSLGFTFMVCGPWFYWMGKLYSVHSLRTTDITSICWFHSPLPALLRPPRTVSISNIHTANKDNQPATPGVPFPSTGNGSKVLLCDKLVLYQLCSRP